MDIGRFLDNFAIVADSPGGIQQLRAFVLDLAVQGYLVDRDGYEPAPAVTPKSTARPSWLSDAASQASGEQPPFNLPAAWRWIRLGEIATYVQRGKGPSYADGPTSLVVASQKCVQWSGFELSPARFAKDETKNTYGPERFLRSGDLLWNSTGTGTVGRVAIYPDNLSDRRVVADSHVTVVRIPDCDPRFVLAWLSSSHVQSRIASITSGTTQQQELNTSTVREMLVPLPPLAEQQRIVGKVNELLGLCDELEVSEVRKHDVADRFRRSALHALTKSVSTDALRRAWSSVSANWASLTCDVHSVAEFRPVALQLAMEGRLVGRLSEEGNADDLLALVQEERLSLALTGAINGFGTRTKVEAEDAPFALPDHWAWVHLEDLCTHIVDCLHRTPPYAPTGYPAIRTCDVEPGRVLVDQALRVDEATYMEQVARLKPEAGDVLYSREGGRYGIAAVVPPGTSLCLSQRMMQFRCASAIVPEYFAWFLNSPLGVGQAAQDVGGSASPHVNIRSIRRFVVPLPPTGEQQRIVEQLEKLDQQARALERSIDLRDQLAERVTLALRAGV